jgi:uncharacterized protein (DUF1684 family)
METTTMNSYLLQTEMSATHETVHRVAIPRDGNNNIIGTSWQSLRERMYNNLSLHYGIDLQRL